MAFQQQNMFIILNATKRSKSTYRQSDYLYLSKLPGNVESSEHVHRAVKLGELEPHNPSVQKGWIGGHKSFFAHWLWGYTLLPSLLCIHMPAFHNQLSAKVRAGLPPLPFSSHTTLPRQTAACWGSRFMWAKSNCNPPTADLSGEENKNHNVDIIALQRLSRL